MNPGPAFGLFCNPESLRAEGFCRAAGRALRQWPVCIPWPSVLEGGWQKLLQLAPRFLRLESPGRNWAVERLLQLRGAAAMEDVSEAGWRAAPASEVLAWENDPGRIHPMRQWFLGWRSVLQELEAWAVAGGLASRWLCPPRDVLTLFDKAACQQVLEQAGVAVPPALGIPRNFDDLWERMRATGHRRVFLKPCHGSSASGVVALESARHDLQAFSTVALEPSVGGLRLYNRRRIECYRGARAVRELVDAVCRERCLAQAWVPKAGLHGRAFDVRILVIAGVARHVVVRLGRGPITNSQLLGGRGNPQQLRQRMGPDHWEATLRTCERAVTVGFPGSLYAGCDVVVEPNFRTTRILEVNAFGDLLPRAACEGRDTYEWEVAEALRSGGQKPAPNPADPEPAGDQVSAIGR